MGDDGSARGETVERRFADALVKARAEWAAADAAACAARAGCEVSAAGVLVPFFGTPHLVTHPAGEVGVTAGGKASADRGEANARGGEASAGGGEANARGEAGPAIAAEPGSVHVAVAVLLLHYLLTASGAPPAGAWKAYRELPGGLFYAASFAARAEAPLTRVFGADAAGLDAFARSARAAGGEALDLADAAFTFAALRRVPVAALVWRGDDEEPGEARVLFDAGAGEYLPPEDLAGLGGLLARRLVAG
jgi:hypothetical protein